MGGAWVRVSEDGDSECEATSLRQADCAPEPKRSRPQEHSGPRPGRGWPPEAPQPPPGTVVVEPPPQLAQGQIWRKKSKR
jgi:hypothetical protein